jgi:hypothetical protein
MRIDVLFTIYDIWGERGRGRKIGSLSYLDHFMSISCIITIYHLHISLTMHYRLSVYLV